MILDLVNIDLWNPNEAALQDDIDNTRYLIESEIADLREYQAIVLARCDELVTEIALGELKRRMATAPPA